MDINDIIRKLGSAVEVQVRAKKNNRTKIIPFHCGLTRLTDRERKSGWCATSLDRKGRNWLHHLTSKINILDKISSWGFCRSACTDHRDSIMFANLNLLTDEECETLLDKVDLLKIITPKLLFRIKLMKTRVRTCISEKNTRFVVERKTCFPRRWLPSEGN